MKELLATYLNSTYDAWYVNSTEGISLNKLYVILFHTYFSVKKIAEVSAKLLGVEEWDDVQTRQ